MQLFANFVDWLLLVALFVGVVKANYLSCDAFYITLCGTLSSNQCLYCEGFPLKRDK